MSKLVISSEEAFRVQRDMMVAKAMKHFNLALYWIEKLKKSYSQQT